MTTHAEKVRALEAELQRYEQSVESALAVDADSVEAPRRAVLSTSVAIDTKGKHPVKVDLDLKRQRPYFPSQPVLDAVLDAMTLTVRVDGVKRQDDGVDIATVRPVEGSRDTFELPCAVLREQEFVCDDTESAAVEQRLADHLRPAMGAFADTLAKAAAAHVTRRSK